MKQSDVFWIKGALFALLAWDVTWAWLSVTLSLIAGVYFIGSIVLTFDEKA